MHKLIPAAKKLLEEAKAVEDAAQDEEARASLPVTDVPKSFSVTAELQALCHELFVAVDKLHEITVSIRDEGLSRVRPNGEHAGEYTIQHLQEAIRKVDRLLKSAPFLSVSQHSIPLSTEHENPSVTEVAPAGEPPQGQ